MDKPATLMAEASGLRTLVRFAQINGLQLRAFLSQELMEIVETCDSVERIPAHAIVDALEITAFVGRRPAIGIELASWADMHSIGMLSALLDACPNISEALRIQSKYVHLESFALDATVEEFGNEVMVRHILRIAGQFGHSQYAEGALLVAIRMIRMTAGELWSPSRVEFEHPEPADTRVHRAQFRCPIRFGAERNAFFIPVEELNRPLPRGNPRMLAYLEQHLETLGFALSGTVESEVTKLIAQNLSAGRSSLAMIAKAMGLQPRALQRRLADEGLEFSELLTRVRRQVVENFVRAERQPELTRLAFRLGYSEPSNASRFLRQQFGKGLRQIIREVRRADSRA